MKHTLLFIALTTMYLQAKPPLQKPNKAKLGHSIIYNKTTKKAPKNGKRLYTLTKKNLDVKDLQMTRDERKQTLCTQNNTSRRMGSKHGKKNKLPMNTKGMRKIAISGHNQIILS